ncbi:MAG: DUF1844 domain-containing protein [Actinomycetota bacterium]
MTETEQRPEDPVLESTDKTLGPDEQAALLEKLRDNLARAPGADLVIETAAPLIGAIHIKLGDRSPDAAPADLPGARLLIDALAGLLDATRGRLGENEAALASALAQARLAFVQASGSEPSAPGADNPRTANGPAEAGPSETEGV